MSIYFEYVFTYGGNNLQILFFIFLLFLFCLVVRFNENVEGLILGFLSTEHKVKTRNAIVYKSNFYNLFSTSVELESDSVCLSV